MAAGQRLDISIEQLALGRVEIEPVELIPLARALLCVNCNMITRSERSAKSCAVCGSRSLLSVAKALEGRRDRPVISSGARNLAVEV